MHRHLRRSLEECTLPGGDVPAHEAAQQPANGAKHRVQRRAANADQQIQQVQRRAVQRRQRKAELEVCSRRRCPTPCKSVPVMSLS